MENLEKVEKIREKCGVTYEDAKNALEACNYDMLDAIVYLEKQGKVKSPEQPSYPVSNVSNQQNYNSGNSQERSNGNGASFSDCVDGIFNCLGKLVKAGCQCHFRVDHEGKRVLSMPVLVFVILLIISLPITGVLLIIGLFCDFHYHFDGVSSVDLNDVCDKASNAASNIKNDVKYGKTTSVVDGEIINETTVNDNNNK